jgi:hypothetical protein
MIKSFGLIASGALLLAIPTIPVAGALAGTPAPAPVGAPAGTSVPAALHGKHRSPTARAARTLSIADTAAMHYTGGSGSLLHETGAATGTLPGSMKAECNIGATLSTSFTIYAAGGTIKGHGTATPHGSGAVESFAGTLTATGGTGRYAHAHGHTGLYGTFNRRNYALTVQTTGKLSY